MQLTALHGRRKCVGSAVMVVQKRLILSCAHNFVQISQLNNRRIEFKNHLAYWARCGKESWKKVYQISPTGYRVHPLYDGNSNCGFDIAFCFDFKRLFGSM